MFEGVFSFGLVIQDIVSPVLGLFTKPGFAPFLAFSMATIAFLLILWMYFFICLPGKNSLKKARRAVETIEDEKDFTAKFTEIHDVLANVKILRHGWEEFRETLIFPEDQEKTQVIRNTIRPGFYLNAHDVESSLKLRSIHFISNLFVGIGLFFTFIGLVAALTEAGHALGSNGDNFQEPIQQLLAVAAFKFWTSVAGLGSSIVLRIFYERQHSTIKRIVGGICRSLERGLQFVTPEYLGVEQLRQAQEQSAAMKAFSTDVAVSLTTALQPVNQSLQDIGHKITGSVGDALQNAAGSEMKALATNLGGIVESLTASRSEMDNVANTLRVAMQEAASELKKASGEASTEMSQQLKEILSSLAEDSRRQASMFDQSMERFSGLMNEAGNNAHSRISDAANDLANGMNGVSDGVRDAAGTMAARMEALASIMEAMEERFKNHVSAMEAITTTAQSTEKAMGETTRHLGEAAAPVTQASEKMALTAQELGRSVGELKSTLIESHSNLNGLVDKMADTQDTLQQAWASYDQRFGEVDESLAKVLRDIVDNVNANLSTMSNFVQELDKDLGAAIANFGESVSGLSDTAEDFETASSQLLTGIERASQKQLA